MDGKEGIPNGYMPGDLMHTREPDYPDLQLSVILEAPETG